MREYNKVDRKAPRFRLSKYRYIALNRELFENFKIKYPEIQLDYLKFKELIISINEEFVNIAMEERDGVILPCGMGKISLELFPPKVRPDNESIIGNQGIPATHFNFQSGGFVGKILWTFNDILYRTSNVKYYGFIGHRTFKNKASNAFRNEPEKYCRIATIIRAHEYYKRKKNERNEVNSKSGDKSGEDT